MSDLRLRISIIEKNERGQEVELVKKVIQFKPQVFIKALSFFFFLLYMWPLKICKKLFII